MYIPLGLGWGQSLNLARHIFERGTPPSGVSQVTDLFSPERSQIKRGRAFLLTNLAFISSNWRPRPSKVHCPGFGCELKGLEHACKGLPFGSCIIMPVTTWICYPVSSPERIPCLLPWPPSSLAGGPAPHPAIPICHSINAKCEGETPGGHLNNSSQGQPEPSHSIPPHSYNMPSLVTALCHWLVRGGPHAFTPPTLSLTLFKMLCVLVQKEIMSLSLLSISIYLEVVNAASL